MDLSEVTAIVLIRNESYFLESVLHPLVKYLPRVIVFDTGSTDNTAEIARRMGAEVHLKGVLPPSVLGTARTEMCKLAQTPWIWLNDGDELYPESTFLALKDQEMPEGKKIGFTSEISVDWKPKSKEFVLLADRFSRTAIFSKDTTFSGDYPFEMPNWFSRPETFHYFDLPDAYHLHRLVRSPADEMVFFRNKKRLKFSLMDRAIPEIGKVLLPFNQEMPEMYR